MVQPRPPTTTVKFTAARQQLSQVVNQVHRQETRVLIEKNGVPVAALISPRDFAWFIRLDAEREARFDAIRAFSRAFADGAVEELERQVEIALAQVRARRRQEALTGVAP